MSEKAKDPELINKNISHKPIDYETLNRLSEDFGKRFTPQQEMDAEQAFWFRISNPTIESSNPPPVKVEVPSELPKEIVKQVKAKQPLDKELDFACKHAQRIQELLVYVRDTCPNAINLSAKKVVVTPKNKVKKVRFVEPLTSSSNIKQVESSKTSDSNTPVLSSTGLKCSTSKCGSKPNKKNDRISRTPSRNMKNKVEAQTRKVNKKNRVVEPICDVDVKHSLLNANSEPICATCKKSMFDSVHDMITSANIVPPKKTTSDSVKTQKPELKVYSRKPKYVKNVGSSKKAKIVESKNANHSEPNHTWGSNATDIPSSSSLVMTGCLDCALLAKDGLARGIPRLKFHKDHMFSACTLGKSKKSSHQPKAEDTNQEKLYLLHMDLCGSMRVASINEKRYILVMVDDYSRFTWVRFLRSKDEAPEAIIKCIKNIQVHLNATVRNDKKPDLSFFHIFRALCYPKNDNDDMGKLDAKADIGPGLQCMTPATYSSGLVPNHVSQQPYIPPNRDDWDHLFQPMFDEYFNPPSIAVTPV
ncbi:retrovirus-related pol polyprotein from transposon TNT 1-94 [Tanacetum coccineum]